MKLNDEFGEDFPLEVKVIEAKTRGAESRFRGIISLGILISSAIALAVATILGLFDGIFNELNLVWSLSAPFIGAVTVHYLGKKND